MDTTSQPCYNLGHETPWNSPAIRKPKTSSHRHAACELDILQRGPTCESVLEFCYPMVSGLSTERAARASKPGEVGTSPPALPRAGRRAKATVVAGGLSSRAFHRLVDLKADCPPDPEALQGSLHPRGGWKLLRCDLGWSCQKPERRALQRDEEAIARWKRYTWPRIKKSPRPGGPSRLS